MKEAVAFVIDASPSMKATYPSCLDGELSTRFSCAKQALVAMISDLMLQSIQNEVTVVVCKTPGTHHHMIAAGEDVDAEDDVAFPNVTELTDGVVRPSVDLLRRISSLEATEEDKAVGLRGDICDAILVAADAIYHRSNKRKFQRRIVLLTDAGHDVVLDIQQTLHVVESLRDLDCRLAVIGMGFSQASRAEYAEPANGCDQDFKRIKTESTEKDSDTQELNDSEGIIVYPSKSDRERLLSSLVEKTGGFIMPADTLQQVLEMNKGKKLNAAVRRKFIFHVAPGLSFEARSMLTTKKLAFPRISTEAAMVDEETKEALRDSSGQEMMCKVTSVVNYANPEGADDVVDVDNKTDAIRYGSNLIPMSSFDFGGLKDKVGAGPRVDILGYVDRAIVPRLFLMGPPYIFSGDASHKACATLAGIAKSLHSLDKIGVCTMIKTKDSAEAIVGALIPARDPQRPKLFRLSFLQLPFSGEVKRLSLAPFDDILTQVSQDKAYADAADNLVDSLMLPNGCLQSGGIPSPVLRSWNQSMVDKAMNPDASLVFVRETDDQMVTPAQVLENADASMHNFMDVFRLSSSENREKKLSRGRQGRVIATYKDHVDTF